jgi:uncharacterized membrane protein (UPF0127 family)
MQDTDNHDGDRHCAAARRWCVNAHLGIAEQPAKRKNGIAKAKPFPENNTMLFYKCRPWPALFLEHINIISRL